MTKRNLLAILSVLVLMLSVVLVPTLAQDDTSEEDDMMMEEAGYGVPEGYEVVEDEDGGVVMTSGDDTITIISDTAYNQALGGQEFETDQEELAFFLDRSGFNVGTEQPVPEGALAANGVSLSRRGATGIAYLYDTGLDRFAVISLHVGRGQTGAPVEDVQTVVDGFVYVGSIVDIAIENSEGGNDDREGLSLLVRAVQNADAVVLNTLSGEGSFTVFAPNNQAFLNLTAFLESNYGIDDIFADENQALLTQVLLYHVVEGEVGSADVLELTSGASVPTLLDVEQDGIVVNILDDGSVRLNGNIALVATDIPASNGVIHIIDDVLLPQCVIDTLEGVGSCDAPAAEEEDSDG